jgi:hypothetical protein
MSYISLYLRNNSINILSISEEWHAAAEPQYNVLVSDQWQLWDRNAVLPDDGPVGPKHVGVIFKINCNMCRRF